MIQVTAYYQGAEIGYGEGESLTYAVEECMSTIDTMYTEDYDTVRFIDLGVNGHNSVKSLDLSTVFYEPRQYF
jgi:hypothetical protein